MSTSSHRRQQLLTRTQQLCSAFTSPSPPDPEHILTEHFVPSLPKITEHGPSWASARLPFLGRTFEGKTDCLEYFRTLGETLSFEPAKDTFPTCDSDFAIDESANADPSQGDASGASVAGGNKPVKAGSVPAGSGVVTVKGHGTFRSVRTGQNWHEEFVWRLSGFDEEGRVGWWEIWADPLSAWLAVGGELDRISGGGVG